MLFVGQQCLLEGVSYTFGKAGARIELFADGMENVAYCLTSFECQSFQELDFTLKSPSELKFPHVFSHQVLQFFVGLRPVGWLVKRRTSSQNPNSFHRLRETFEKAFWEPATVALSAVVEVFFKLLLP